MRPTLVAPRHATPRSSPASTTASSSRRARRAPSAGLPGWLLGLDQPTYVAVVTDAESARAAARVLRAWCTRASDQGPTPAASTTPR